MTVDIIILSNAKNNHLWQLTNQSIESCHASERNIQFNIVVIEQNKEAKYQRCTVVYIDEPFNYNAFMNKGIALTSNEYICLCNNDLYFRPNWCSNIINAMEAEYLLSASPLCPKTQGAVFNSGPEIDYGYSNGKHLSGWCIMCNRFLFDIIGPINDEFPFWFADNVYAEQLKKHNVKHALIRNSWVDHKGQRTLKTEENQNALTMAWAKKFIEKYPHNESAIYFSQFV